MHGLFHEQPRWVISTPGQAYIPADVKSVRDHVGAVLGVLSSLTSLALTCSRLVYPVVCVLLFITLLAVDLRSFLGGRISIVSGLFSGILSGRFHSIFS